MEENISVVVRVRPQTVKETKRGETVCVTAGNSLREIQIHTGTHEAQAYSCNRFFSSSTTQAEFFAESGIPNLLDSVIGGFHACSFAFGQTGAGKTFTCTGPTQSVKLNTDNDGIMGRSLQYVFDKLNSIGVQYVLKMACMEIYHENVFDLSLPERSKTSLSIREHPDKGFFAEGCKQVHVRSVFEAVNMLDHAMKLRQVGSHEMNSRSNRSHFMTELFIELSGESVDAANHRSDAGATRIFGDLKSKLDGDQDFDILGKMTFIDLAGSERLKSTSSSGQMQSDTGFINKSLYVLGKVIAGLVRGAAEGNVEVPYRESKLTKLLINSLGGKCRTLLISCISESSSSVQETLRTLKFSMTAAKIKNRPVRFLDPQEKLILDLRDEIKRLKEENEFLVVSLMANPPQPSAGDAPPLELYRAKTGGEAPSPSKDIYQQYSQSHTAGTHLNKNYSDSREKINGVLGGHRSHEVSGSRNVILKKINKSHKKGGKKQPSPYLHGNNLEAQELYVRMSGKGGSSHRLVMSKKQDSIYSSSPSSLSQQTPSSNNTSKPLKSLREKLAVLKFELEEKRQFMEDNPGTITEQHEMQLNDLEKEVKEMHLELKAVSSLEGIGIIGKSVSDTDLSFPVTTTVTTTAEYPLPKFEKEKPPVPSYSAYDMNNKKIYDQAPPPLSKKANLVPIPSAESVGALANIERLEMEYVHRKQHLDAYINGKKQLDTLPSNTKPKHASNSNIAVAKVDSKNKKESKPISQHPVGKGFNSSLARDLNYPGRKKDTDPKETFVPKPSVPVVTKAKPSTVDKTVVGKESDVNSPLLPLHSKFKKEVKPDRRPSIIGKVTDDSVFGINSSFDSRYDNMLKKMAGPMEPTPDPYGVSGCNESFKAPLVDKSPSVFSDNDHEMQRHSVGFDEYSDEVNCSGKTDNNNPSNKCNNNNKISSDESPEQQEDEEDDEYADDEFEDAYDNDYFED